MTFPYPTISSFFEAEGDFQENREDPEFDVRDAEIASYRNQATGEIDPALPGVKWFLNEEGNPYAYPEHLQHEHYPNDFDLVYETEDQAEAAASALWGSE